MATKSIASLGLGNADLTAIGKLSETGLSQVEIADAVVEGDKLKKGNKIVAYDGHLANVSNPHNTTAGQVGAYTKAEVDNLIDAIPTTDLSGYYNKTEVDNLIDSIPTTDLSGYYTKAEVYSKLESYSKAEVDSLIAGGGADLSDYYTKAQVDSLISAIPTTDLSNYYNKAQVDSLIGAIPETDLTNYYNKTEVYNKLESYSKAEVDGLIAGGGADLSDYYTKAQVDGLISAIPETDLTNYYNKTQVDSLIDAIPETDLTNYYNKTEVDILIPNISTKQDVLVSGTTIKTINGESILGSGDLVISGGGTVDLSDYYKKTETYSKVEVDNLIDAIPETDLSGYYNKTETYSKVEVDTLIADIPETDLSNYYNKTETYNKNEVDTLIDNIPETDLTNYYTKSETYSKVETYNKIEVDTIISNIPETDLTNYYNKTQVDSLIDAIPETDLSGYYNKTQTETLLSDKVDKEVGKGLSTNDFTDTFKQALELNKVQNITTNSVTKKLVVTYTNGTSVDLNLDDVITDVKVESATLDATTNVLTILSSDGGADVTVDLSVFVTNQTLNNALVGKADKIHTHSTSDIDGLDTTLSSKVDKNEAIIGATKTKITYDSNGLVTGGVDLSTSDIPNLPQSKIINLETNLSSKIDKGVGVVGATKTKITYNNDGIITGGADLAEADLPDISQAKITNLVTDLSNKQEVLVSGTSIKTINGQSVLGSGNIEITSEEVDLTNYYDKTNTDTLLSNKVDKITGKGLSTNDFTDTFKQALELKKVQDISTDSVTKKLVVTYTDGTSVDLNLDDVITDVKVSGATLDATTNVLTLIGTDGGADVTVNLSDFVNSSELTTALAGKVSKIVSTDDAIVAFSGTTGDVRDSLFKIADLKTYIGKASTKIVATDLKTLGVVTVNWIGGIVPTAKAGATTVTGLIGAIAGTWNKIGDSTTLLTTAKTTIVEAINELFNGKVSKIGADDIEVTLATKGVILKSPNGTRYKITVNDDGSLQTTGV